MVGSASPIAPTGIHCHPRVLSPGDRLRPHPPGRHRAGRRPPAADVRRASPEFSPGRWGQGRSASRFISLSKGFNMIGWRMAFVAGHPQIVQAFADVKDNSDSGQFMAIQQAAKAAADHRRLATAYAKNISVCKTGVGVGQGWLHGQDAGGDVFPLRQGPQRLRRPDLRRRGGSFPIPHQRTIGNLRAVGQCRGLFYSSPTWPRTKKKTP